MAKKGARTTQKRISAPAVVKIRRKEKKFSIRTMPGTHARKKSVALGIVVRDLLGIAKNANEARIALNSENIAVDGKTRKERQFPVGLFDVVKVRATGKAYRAVYDSRGRIALIEIPEKEAEFKLCRIERKQISKGGKIQLTVNDGSNYFEEKTKAKVGDTLKIKLPERKVMEHYALAKGSLIYVIGGKHVSETAKAREIAEGTLQREKLLVLEAEGKEFQTNAGNAFVIGEKKAELQLKQKGE